MQQSAAAALTQHGLGVGRHGGVPAPAPPARKDEVSQGNPDLGETR